MALAKGTKNIFTTTCLGTILQNCWSWWILGYHDDHNYHGDHDDHDEYDDFLERVLGAMVGRAAQGITSSCHWQTTNSLLLVIILKIIIKMIIKRMHKRMLKRMLKIILKLMFKIMRITIISSPSPRHIFVPKSALFIISHYTSHFLAALAALYLTLVTEWVSESVTATLEFRHKEWLLRLETLQTFDWIDV